MFYFISPLNHGQQSFDLHIHTWGRANIYFNNDYTHNICGYNCPKGEVVKHEKVIYNSH